MKQTQVPRAGLHSRRCRVQVCRACEKHFERSSLQARGTSQPSDIIQHCLVQLRNPNRFDTELNTILTPNNTVSNNSEGSKTKQRFPVLAPLVQLKERGPLADYSSVLDIGARRVFPGHLLRRSRVLSTFQPSPSLFQQRIAVTACHGEESVFKWSLRYELSPEGAPCWKVVSVDREIEDPSEMTENFNFQLPTTPHPRCSPESIVLAQLDALKKNSIFDAACFMLWSRLASYIPKEEEDTDVNSNSSNESAVQFDDRFPLGLHYERLKHFLSTPAFSMLLEHTSVVLGPAALPTQRCQYQQVLVEGADGEKVWFLWTLGMQSNGCWMVIGIERLT